MKTIIKVLLSVFATIGITNLPPLKWITVEDLLYSNACGSFTFDEVNYANRNYKLCLNNFRAFKCINKMDTILYRITPKKIYKVWLWGDYLFNEKYELPYRSYREIEKSRGLVGNKTAWQDY